ncbi:hypothetical protein Phou_063200 [Phytohabitans houttuyneae]|uniref:Uncharacterized protein n=1 Tax=Phytohabitans houttuyneae TaxID=1076126 RepID=A0A6V8KFB6_9ACTN|nr:hypothetical protein Phou_063200 [Phytohabitans houttuyneae]
MRQPVDAEARVRLRRADEHDSLSGANAFGEEGPGGTEKRGRLVVDEADVLVRRRDGHFPIVAAAPHRRAGRTRWFRCI